MKLAWTVLVLAAACGGGDDEPTGTFAVSWTLTGGGAATTCDAYKISDIVVTATETTSGNTQMVSAACAAGMVVTQDLPIGTYKVTLDAMGTEGDKAGTATAMGALTEMVPDVTLAPAAITVLAPTAMLMEMWTLKHNGTASSCGAVQNTGVQFDIAPKTGSPSTDIWDCVPGVATIVDVPYGPLTATGTLLGNGGSSIAVSAPLAVPAFRGTATAQVTIEY